MALRPRPLRSTAVSMATNPTPAAREPVIRYPVHKIEGKYFLEEVKGGTRVLPYICNSLVLLNELELQEEDVEKATISNQLLYDKIAPLGRLRSPNLTEEENRDLIANCFKEYEVSPTYLDPTFDGVDTFSDNAMLAVCKFFGLSVFHAHILDPQYIEVKKIIEGRGCSELSKSLKKKKRHIKKKALDNNWTIIDNLLNQHTPHSVACLIEKINIQVSVNKMEDAVCLFFWKNQLNTIKLHDGTLYVLDVAASCIVNQILWQKLTVITDSESTSKNIFFDNKFRHCGERISALVKGNGEASNVKAVDTDKSKLIHILPTYGFDFMAPDLVEAVSNSIERNARLVSELEWPILSQQMAPIISDHSEVYSTCVKSILDTTVEESLVVVVRDIKGSIMNLVIAFLQKAELSEKLEKDCIAPFMNIVLKDYFENAHENISPVLHFLSMTSVEKCTQIDQIFNHAFASCEFEMETGKHLYLFSLLAKISSHRFQLLTKLPYKHVLRKFSQELKEKSTLIVDNLPYIVELLQNFEKNIIGDNLLGPVLNESMSVIFDSIVSVYSALARKEPSGTSEDTLRSLESAIYKLVEAFLEKAEWFGDLEKVSVIPLMNDALNGYMSNSAKIPSEFLSLSKMIIKKCTEARIIIETLFNCSHEITTYEQKYDYIIILLGEACAHRSQILTQLPVLQLNYVMKFIRWAIKDRKYHIGQTGAKLLIQILNAFEAPDVQNTSYKEHVLEIVEDIVTILVDAVEPDMELVCFDLLKQLFSLTDKLSEPLWDDKQVPFRYNLIFLREHAANCILSNCGALPHSAATEFVQGIFVAMNDPPSFLERSSILLRQLKMPQQTRELIRASTSNETRPSSSSAATSYLFDETGQKHCERRLKQFLTEFTQRDCHSPHYEAVVLAMYWTGANKMEISFEHIVSHDPSLAEDLLVVYSRFKHKIKAVVVDYVSYVKNNLSDVLKNSKPPRLSLCGEIAVSIVGMPESIENFSEFIKRPGNEITKRQTIFHGDYAVEIQEKTDIGRIALCSYIQDMCQVHANGESFDGELTLKDFKVFNGTEFRICRRTCRQCTHSTHSKDFKNMSSELLSLYGDSAFVKALVNEMRNYMLEGEYNPVSAKRFRFRMITHLAGKSPVLIALIFIDFCRGYQLLRGNSKSRMNSMLSLQVPIWITKVKGNRLLLKLYNYNTMAVLESIMKMKKTVESLVRDANDDSEDEEEGEDVVNALADLKKIVTEGIEDDFTELGHIQLEEPVIQLDEPVSEDNVFGHLAQPGDKIYNSTLLSLVFFVRHGVIHIADPNKVGKRTVIKNLNELELLLSHVLEEEMAQVLGQFVLNSHLLTDEGLEMMEESWKIYARLESNRQYSEPLSLRDLKSLK